MSRNTSRTTPVFPPQPYISVQNSTTGTGTDLWTAVISLLQFHTRRIHGPLSQAVKRFGQSQFKSQVESRAITALWGQTQELFSDCVLLVNAGENEAAVWHYVTMVEKLKETYFD